MARRVIRKLDIAGRATLDEQLWPINALLVVLCALSAGVIIGSSEFTDQLTWNNGWMRLATLIASFLLLLTLAWSFRGQIGRRFQLGAVVSLLLHAVVAVILHWQHLSVVHDSPQTPRRDTPPVLVHYEYEVRLPDEQTPREVHERPVETETPQDRPVELTRTPVSAPTIQQPQPRPLNETQRSVEPTRVEMKRNEFAAPKRATAESRLSRSATEVPSQPSDQISAPEQRAATEVATSMAGPSATAVARSKASTPVSPGAADTPPELEVARNASQPARRVTEDSARPAPSQTETIARAVAPAAPSAASEIASPAAIAEQRPSSTPTGPAQDLARQAASASTSSPESLSGPAPSSAGAVAQAPSALPQQLASPTVTATTHQNSRVVASATSSATDIPNPQIAAPSAARSTTIPQQPAATSIDRSTAGTVGIGQSPNFDQGLPAPTNRQQVASAAAQRAPSTLETGPSPAASIATPLGRSRAQALVESATAAAQDALPPEYRSSPNPLTLEATSAAALTQRASTAPAGQLAADVGDLAADTGAARVVSVAGAARSDGGGQPSVTDRLNTDQPDRATASAEPTLSVAEVAIAPVAAANADNANPRSSLTAQQDANRSTSSTGLANNLQPSVTGAITGDQGSVAAASVARATTDQNPDAPSGAAAATPVRSAPSGFSVAQNVQLPADTESANPSEGAGPVARAIDRRATESSSLAGIQNPSSDPSTTPTTIQSLTRRPSSQPGEGDGPTLSTAPALARAMADATRASEGQTVEAPTLADNQSATRTVSSGDNQPGPATGPSALERQASGGVPVQIAAAPGPGGLALDASPVVGSRKLSAQRDSELIHDTDTRFLGREITGAIPVPNFVRDAARAFERRGRENGTGEGPQAGKTEEAIERGLEFLARSQQADGSWSFQRFAAATADDSGSIHSDTAATGLALMAFLGGGYDHFEDKHRDTVRRGIHFLVRRQKESGDLYHRQDADSHNSAWLYSHAIASIALCEALGMTGDVELVAPAQRAIDFIEAAQDRQYGGWRYVPGEGSDTSVAGWQLMALKSGELAGLKVKPETYTAVSGWLDRAQVREDGSRYIYNPIQPNTQYLSDQRRPTMTAVGILMRLYLGWDRTRPQVKRAADHVLSYPAAYGTAANPMRDTYYWYYATQVMFHMGDPYWARWRAQLHPLLVSSQIPKGASAGSWHPNGAIADRWGPHGGRLYVTTMNLLSLEVSYRHLPIYEATAK